MLCGALRVGIRGIHLLHVKAAVGHLRDGRSCRTPAHSRCARCGRRCSSTLHARPSACDRRLSHLRSPVIRRRRRAGCRAVAAHGTGSRSPGADPGSSSPRAPSCSCGNGKRCRGKVHASRRSKKASESSHSRARHRDARMRLRFRRAFAMHPVARQARHRRLIGEVRAHQMPWPLRILRLHQIAHGAIEVHAVAAKAVVHQPALASCAPGRQRSGCKWRCAAPHARWRIRAGGTSGSSATISTTSTSRSRIASGQLRIR